MSDPRLLGAFIPLHYHHNMLNDRPRMAGFKQALEIAVPPGGKVLELGGGTGVLSFFAAARASRVWCVEYNPELASEARRILALNTGGENVEVVEADAFEYVPPEPVDVVICEMLHAGLLREQQAPVIAAFKRRYQEAFGPTLPAFVPEASVLAVQPVQQSFEFLGYYAPVPIFQDAGVQQEGTVELAPPASYGTADYADELPDDLAWQGTFSVASGGTLNALRFITKNVLAIVMSEGRTIDWYSQSLVLPLSRPLAMAAGDRASVRFSYRPGDEIETLSSSIEVKPQ
ncbi:MAG TPA: methyltransferase domain-containing protein [Chloroflexota bacterium]